MQKSLKSQFSINLTTNILLFVLNIFIGIWIVPYLIYNIGISSYGFISLSLSIVNYIGLITLSFNASMSRYLTIDLQCKDFISANRTFNTGFWGILVISMLVLPLIFVVSFFAPSIFNIPPGQENGSRIALGGILISSFLSIIGSNLSVFAFALNRLDIKNGLEAFKIVSKTLFIILLFTLFSPQIWYVGLAHFVDAFLFLILSWIVCSKLVPEVKVRMSEFDISRFRDIIGTGGWVLINQIGALLFLSIDLIIVNKIFGAESTGRYATVLQWSNLLRSLVSVISGTITPIIFACYAKKQMDKILLIQRKAIKFLGLVIALPIGLLCGFSSSILSVWVGPDFADLSWLMKLLLFHLCINLAVIPLFSVQMALNKVRTPGLVTFIMGIVNVVLAIILSSWLSWGMYGVAAAGAITLSTKNVLFTPLYSSYILKKPWYTFLTPIISCMISTIVISFITFSIEHYFHIKLISLIFYASIISLLYFMIIGFIVFRQDRDIILSFISKKARLES